MVCGSDGLSGIKRNTGQAGLDGLLRGPLRIRINEPGRARNRPTGIFDGAAPVLEARPEFFRRLDVAGMTQCFPEAARARRLRSSIGRALAFRGIPLPPRSKCLANLYIPAFPFAWSSVSPSVASRGLAGAGLSNF